MHILKLSRTGKFALNVVDNLVVVHHQDTEVWAVWGGLVCISASQGCRKELWRSTKRSEHRLQSAFYAEGFGILDRYGFGILDGLEKNSDFISVD